MFSRIATRAPRAFVRFNSSSSTSRAARIVEMAGQVEKPSTSPNYHPLTLGLLLTIHRRTRGFRPRYVGRVRRVDLHCVEQDGRAQGRRLG